MAGHRGKSLAYLKVDGTKVEETKGDLTIDSSTGEIDLRTDSSDGYNEATIGDKTVTISGSFNYMLESESKTAQQAIIDADAGSTILADLEWAYEENSTAKNFTADGFVTNVSNVNGDPQVMSFTIRISEKPTQGTQT